MLHEGDRQLSPKANKNEEIQTMSYYNTIFNQILHLIPRHQFEGIVKRYEADRYVKYFNCCLRTQSNKWYHIGLRDIKRSTLSDANKHRDWKVYEELFYSILRRCKDVTPRHKFRFNNPLYTLDSTVVELCLSLYPWARFRKRKGCLRYIIFMTIVDVYLHL